MMALADELFKPLYLITDFYSENESS
jgi:hypothetical protein